ncbi:MAG: hypothetical protein IKY92_02735 [Akkermansia sp.]|nr:hypothetical protein [Akkermansia sp.]
MADEVFQNLTPQEIQELSLCGITTEAQLQAAGVSVVLRDLAKIKLHFPDKQLTLTQSKLESLFSDADAPQDVTQSTSAQDVLPHIENVGPTISFHRTSRTDIQSNQQRSLQSYPNAHHSAVRASHPWLILSAALATLLLIIPACSLVLLPAMMITDNLPDIPLHILAIGSIGVPTVIYILLARIVQCPVCHVHTFSFKDYARNRAAHHIPVLGYNIATALHIIFTWHYMCPGCGTPIKLTGRKSRRHHH